MDKTRELTMAQSVGYEPTLPCTRFLLIHPKYSQSSIWYLRAQNVNMDKTRELTMAQSELIEALFLIYVSVYIAQWLYLQARMREQRNRDRANNE